MNDQVIDKEKILPMVTKKGYLPRQPIFFINLKSNTMKTRCKGTGFPVNCKSFQKKNMFNNIF